MEVITKQYLTELTYEIIGAAIDVHQEMGPGLLEQVYEECMTYELENRNLKVVRQLSIPLLYKGNTLDSRLRLDMLVQDCIVLEIKAVAEWHPIFDAQAMTYARLLKVPKAILINFNCRNIFNEGQKTFVNQYFNLLPE
ncbi:MAG: GxxExxY protein [Saprospiraceae bacterium]|nr:GxxExxY protein [Saprospiraceae bacterium]